MPITAGQCRAARALLGWNQPDLSGASGVSTRTIASFETAEHNPIKSVLAALQAALEHAGIEFLPERGDKGEGVRFAKTGRGRRR